MKILQINTTLNFGSTGRIVDDIGSLLISTGHQSFIGYRKGNRLSDTGLIKIGDNLDFYFHVLKTRLFDCHGFASKSATKRILREVEKINPDVIHLHNIHGYYIHVGILFEYLFTIRKPVIWTLHDCWPFTGHCTYFDSVNCYKWQSECFECPNLKGYPQSWLLDNSRKNYHQKKALFTRIENMTLVTPSQWLANHLKNSFLRQYPVKVINNGVDLSKFKPNVSKVARDKYKLKGKHMLLGVASLWDERKGLADFNQLRSLLDPTFEIILVGLTSIQMNRLPYGIKGISRIEKIKDLAELLSTATVFVNPTYVDNFPTVNLEALACGTPVVTYNTGGSPEAVDEKTGIVVEKGSVFQLAEAVKSILDKSDNKFSSNCRERAVRLYDKNLRYSDYLKLYIETCKHDK